MNKKSNQGTKGKKPSAKAIKNAKARAKKKGKREVMAALAARDPRFAFQFGGLSASTPWGDASVGPVGVTTDSFAQIMHGRSSQPPTVGLAEYTEDIQVVLPEMIPIRGKNGERSTLCVGTEFLSSISNKAGGSAPGDILATLLINPSVFTQTRLVELAKLFQRFRFRKLNFWYKPIANTTQTGQLIGYGDYDPDNINVLDSPDNLSTAAAHVGQATGKLWETIRFPFGVIDDFTTLFVDTNSAEKRLSFQGVYYLFAASEIASTIDALGNLYIDYEVEFSIPLLQPQSAQLALAVIDSGSALTESNPFGTNPGLSTAVAYLPPASLTFSATDESADLFFTEVTGGCSLVNNAVSNGDVWLYMVNESVQLASTSLATGVGPRIQQTVGFTNSLVAELTAFSTNSPGFESATNNDGTASLLAANYDSTSAWIVRSTNNLPITMSYSSALTPAGSANWAINGARLFVMRLYRGAATPSLVSGLGTLDFLRKQERMKRIKRKKEEEMKEDRRSSLHESGCKDLPNELLIRLLEVLGQQKEPELVISSQRQPVWLPDYSPTDRESLPQTSSNLFKRG